jgi:hypothetical protein
MMICLGELLYGSSLILLTAASSRAGSSALCLDRPIMGKAQHNGNRVYTHTHMRPHISGTECVDFLKQDARGNLVVDSLLMIFPLSAFCRRFLV